MIPTLLRERMDDFGIDFMIAYTSIKISLVLTARNELRQAGCKALNQMLRDLCRTHEDRITPAAVIPMFTPQEAIDELVRVTRPGGKLALEFYNPWSLRYLMKRVRPGRISATVKEDAVFTRWDSVGQVMDMAPPGVTVERVHGVRVFTPFAQMHRVPLLGSALGLMERWALRSPLRWFGGFVIVVLSKDAD